MRAIVLRRVFSASLCLIFAAKAHQRALAFVQVAPVTGTSTHTAVADEQTPDDDEDIAPSALSLDQSQSSPLIQALYRATRETKEKQTLSRIAEARALLDRGADVTATDLLGRTALHWTVFGSSYNTRPSVLVAYEQIADLLLQRGVNVNQEDVYQDTALDYLLYSPNFEIQTLLLEHGATSGFLVASFRFFKGTSNEIPRTVADASAQSMRADLAPGRTLSVRLNGPVYSDRSRTGDPIEATVTYPLCSYGEDIACPDGQLVLAPGTRLTGTVLFAQKAPDKYSRPRLVLDFANIVHSDASKSPLYARVLNVDNARETVRNNEIFGIIQPHANGKASLALSAVGAINPIAGYAVRGVSTVYGLSIRREVLFPPGTDLQVQIVRPSMLKQKTAWSGWSLLSGDPTLLRLATTAPLRTATPAGAPSDPTNLLFIGTQQQLLAGFQEAGWYEADARSLTHNLNAVQATIRQTDYSRAPVSTLLLEGRTPDLVFQKSLDTFAQRHHIRIWKLPSTYNGREVWVGAATHDLAVSNSHAKTRWSHRIDPHIDRERDWVQSDLLFAGTASAYANLDRPAAPRRISNATGDVIETDGKIAVVELAGARPGTTPALASRKPAQ